MSFFRKEWKWPVAAILLTVLLLGVLTDFRFTPFEIQLHDRYYLIHPREFIQYGSVMFIFLRYLIQLLDMAARSNRIVAVFFSILTPIVGVLTTALLLMMVSAPRNIRLDISAWAFPIVLLSGILIFLMVMEARFVKYAVALIRKR
jgi:hypothetical protein